MHTDSAEVGRWVLEELVTRAKDAAPVLRDSGRMSFQHGEQTLAKYFHNMVHRYLAISVQEGRIHSTQSRLSVKLLPS